MEFADLHIHALCGVDDGAKTEEEMRQMLDASYADGVRYLCLTPHYHPSHFGNNAERVSQAYGKLCEYAGQKHPGMSVFLGNELRCSPGCLAWLAEGSCHTLNNTRYILVDFFESESEKTIITGLEKLLNAGYIPVLAHAERYGRLRTGLRRIRELRENGVWIQVDIQSIFGGFGWQAKRRARAILAHRLADLVASDAHDLSRRPPGLAAGYQYICRHCGENYAAAVCRENALKILFGGTHEEDADGSSRI